jgi:hypothetical protein
VKEKNITSYIMTEKNVVVKIQSNDKWKAETLEISIKKTVKGR